jgi:GNAT superfamily N-acetyltransferase
MSADGTIRKAGTADVARMVELSEEKRLQYQAYQPRFWRKAPDSQEKQLPHFERVLAADRVIALVHERDGGIDGFVIATLLDAPPVYDPGGLTCLIDDFIAADEAWDTIGAALLEAVDREAKSRGAVQVVVVCGHCDQPKRRMLSTEAFTIASEWYVRPIE